MKDQKTRTGSVLAALIALLGVNAGCDNVSTSLFVEGIATPEDEDDCTFEAEGDNFWLISVLNTAPLGPVQQLSLSLVARIQNVMAGAPRTVGTVPNEELTPPNGASPLRFDFRWECESNGFAPGTEDLILPQFSIQDSFCLNDRDETGDFVGFDAVSASGGIAAPDGGRTVTTFRPIPPQLGLAFDELFQMATLANACCREVGGDCESVDRFANVPPDELAAQGTPCGNLQALFTAVAPGELFVREPADVRRFQPFSIYDGFEPPNPTGALLPLRIRGVFEFVTAAGNTVTTNELVHEVGICRGCGIASTPCSNF